MTTTSVGLYCPQCATDNHVQARGERLPARFQCRSCLKEADLLRWVQATPGTRDTTMQTHEVGVSTGGEVVWEYTVRKEIAGTRWIVTDGFEVNGSSELVQAFAEWMYA